MFDAVNDYITLLDSIESGKDFPDRFQCRATIAAIRTQLDNHNEKIYQDLISRYRLGIQTCVRRIFRKERRKRSATNN